MTQEMKTATMQEGIKKALEDAIAALVVKKQYHSRTWTAAMLDAITNEGKMQGYFTCAPKTQAPKAHWGSEWLFDVCWLEYKGDSLRKLALAAECEWWSVKPEEHEHDFSKLVVARADLRLLICEVQNKTKFAELVEWLKCHAASFDAANNDEYMVSCWIIDDQELVHESFSV